MKKIGELIVATLLLFALMWVGDYFNTGPSKPSAMTTSNPDCQVTILDTDGPGSPSIDQDKLCGALRRAEQDAACMGDWQMPDSISARQLCIETHQHGCGDLNENCDQLPATQIYHSRN